MVHPKILIIDDDQQMCNLIDFILKRRFPEATVLKTLDPSEGLRIAARESPDLVLIEDMMRGLGGSDVLNRLAEWGLPTRSILLTAKPFLLTVCDETTGRGMSGSLRKPFTASELAEKVEQALAPENALGLHGGGLFPAC